MLILGALNAHINNMKVRLYKANCQLTDEFKDLPPEWKAFFDQSLPKLQVVCDIVLQIINERIPKIGKIPEGDGKSLNEGLNVFADFSDQLETLIVEMATHKRNNTNKARTTFLKELLDDITQATNLTVEKLMWKPAEAPPSVALPAEALRQAKVVRKPGKREQGTKKSTPVSADSSRPVHQVPLSPFLTQIQQVYHSDLREELEQPKMLSPVEVEDPLQFDIAQGAQARLQELQRRINKKMEIIDPDTIRTAIGNRMETSTMPTEVLRYVEEKADQAKKVAESLENLAHAMNDVLVGDNVDYENYTALSQEARAKAMSCKKLTSELEAWEPSVVTDVKKAYPYARRDFFDDLYAKSEVEEVGAAMQLPPKEDSRFEVEIKYKNDSKGNPRSIWLHLHVDEKSPGGKSLSVENFRDKMKRFRIRLDEELQKNPTLAASELELQRITEKLFKEQGVTKAHLKSAHHRFHGKDWETENQLRVKRTDVDAVLLGALMDQSPSGNF